MLQTLKESSEYTEELKEEFETVINDHSDNEELNPGNKKDITYKEKNKILFDNYETWKQKNNY